MNLSSHLYFNCLFCSYCCCIQYISKYFFCNDDLCLMICVYCQFRYKQKFVRKLQQASTQQNQSDSLEQDFSHYCSSCNQPCQRSQFGQFKTCEICRTINKNANHKRSQKIPLSNQHFRVPLAETPLQSWVEHASEDRFYYNRYYRGRVIKLSFISKQRVLTIDDYLQEKEPEKLKKQ